MSEKASFYHPELDALRFWAFFQVFYFHVGSRYITGNGMLNHHGWKSELISGFIQAGALGVDLFFGLSSFLITSLLLRECDLNGTFDLKQFWIRRILRIWPLYFFFLALAIFVLPPLSLGKPLSPGYVAAFSFFCGNWACVFNGVPPSVAAPLWSVSVEEQFYIFWPLFLFILTPRRLAPLAIAGLVVASLTRILLVLAGAVHSPNPVVWMNTFTRIDPIAMGALCALVIRQRVWRPARSARAVLAAMGLLGPGLMVFVVGFDNSSKWTIVFYPVVALCCACLLGAIYREQPVRVPPFLVYLGRISYGLYVFHMLAMGIVDKIPMIGGHAPMVKMANAAIYVSLTSVFTFGMAALSYRFLEQRFLKLKSKFTVIWSAPVKVAVSD